MPSSPREARRIPSARIEGPGGHAMATGQGAFEPAELFGDHDHPIGGSYGSLEPAIEAVKAHSRSRHGGGGSFRIYESRGVRRGPTIIEVALDDGDPLAIQSISKVIEGPPGS